ncbi:hypothetical protein PS467_41415 [Streptomyces luomodiensis]|uniref:Uncharacterized protein n=1 Tax=Streptomyces luomodiensis TaxID=3026192 RepID=A0ABY9V8T4_9ACTN|nr:hypothetical protein [Streptomyces sp. SCA4-21]WNF01332.1 hypothetical protein PS467_41415 [Streptomyces sp. SCA4-21]
MIGVFQRALTQLPEPQRRPSVRAEALRDGDAVTVPVHHELLAEDAAARHAVVQVGDPGDREPQVPQHLVLNGIHRHTSVSDDLTL